MTDFGAFQPWTGPGGLLTVEARQHLRKLATTQATGGGGGSTAWADITGKPSTFAPSAHTHDWADLTGVPASFTPSAHTQAASTISDSTTAGRAILTAADAAAQRTALGLGTAATSASTAFAAATHTHTASEVSGLPSPYLGWFVG